VSRVRVVLRLWIEGRLRIEERATAVGSVLTASFTCLPPSCGSRQILDCWLARVAVVYRLRHRMFGSLTEGPSRCFSGQKLADATQNDYATGMWGDVR